MAKRAPLAESRAATADDERALARFAGGPTILDRTEGLRALLQDRGLHRVRETKHFAAGLEWLIRTATDRGDPNEQLQALVMLRKIANTLRSTAPKVSLALRKALEQPIPALSLLESGEDRALAVSWLHHASGSWVIPYLATVAVQEDLQARISRETAIALLFEQTRDISVTFEALSNAVDKWSPSTKTQSETAAKACVAVLDGARKCLAGANIAPGTRPGEALALLLVAIRSKGDDSLKQPMLQEVAENALRVLEQGVRTSFSVAATASTYAPLRALREWFGTFGTTAWPSFASRSEAAAIVARLLEQAITLVAKQGISDQPLFEHLVAATGSRERAHERAKRIADENADMPEGVRRWLATGDFQPTDTLPSEPPMTSWDHERLGQLMQLAEKLDDATRDVDVVVLPEVELLLPRAMQPVRAQLGAARDVSQAVFALAKIRGLRLRGAKGAVERYSPALHRLVGSAGGSGIAWVRLVSPPVEHVRDGGSARVVVQGLAEPAEEPTTE